LTCRIPPNQPAPVKDVVPVFLPIDALTCLVIHIRHLYPGRPIGCPLLTAARSCGEQGVAGQCHQESCRQKKKSKNRKNPFHHRPPFHQWVHSRFTSHVVPRWTCLHKRNLELPTEGKGFDRERAKHILRVFSTMGPPTIWFFKGSTSTNNRSTKGYFVKKHFSIFDHFPSQ